MPVDNMWTSADVIRPPPPYPSQPSAIQNPSPSPAFSYPANSVRGPRFIGVSQQQQGMAPVAVSGSRVRTPLSCELLLIAF